MKISSRPKSSGFSASAPIAAVPTLATAKPAPSTTYPGQRAPRRWYGVSTRARTRSPVLAPVRGERGARHISRSNRGAEAQYGGQHDQRGHEIGSNGHSNLLEMWEGGPAGAKNAAFRRQNRVKNSKRTRRVVWIDTTIASSTSTITLPTTRTSALDRRCCCRRPSARRSPTRGRRGRARMHRRGRTHKRVDQWICTSRSTSSATAVNAAARSVRVARVTGAEDDRTPRLPTAKPARIEKTGEDAEIRGDDKPASVRETISRHSRRHQASSAFSASPTVSSAAPPASGTSRIASERIGERIGTHSAVQD